MNSMSHPIPLWRCKLIIILKFVFLKFCSKAEAERIARECTEHREYIEEGQTYRIPITLVNEQYTSVFYM